MPDGNPNNDGQITEAREDWASSGVLWDANNGTSYAAPRVAGAAAVLFGSGITDPLAIKALLINSARPGRATPAQAMGTQTTWQPDWGWGELDADSAYQQRTQFATAALHPATAGDAGVSLYAATTTGAGDRATITWNRRAVRCVRPIDDPTCPGFLNAASAFTLSNLDLYQYDRATEALQQQSASAIDNVEQVRATAGGQVVYKVANLSSTVDGRADERFALASTRPLTPLAAPVPTASIKSDVAQARTGQDVTVTATMTNTSADLAGTNPQIALELPAGVTLVAGDQIQTVGSSLAAGATSSAATWTVRGTADGLRQLTARASMSRYGSTFSGASATSLLVDGTPPVATISAPSGEQTSPAIAIAWSASDSGSGVKDYDVDVATDGGAFATLTASTTTTAATYIGQRGHSYVFRVRARDQVGNVGVYATSPAISVVASRVRKASAQLRIGMARWTGRIAVSGRISPLARRYIVVSFRCNRSGTTRSVRPRRGRWSATLRPPTRCSRSGRGVLYVRYRGDSRLGPQLTRRLLRRSR
jgi:hypothetical protein